MICQCIDNSRGTIQKRRNLQKLRILTKWLYQFTDISYRYRSSAIAYHRITVIRQKIWFKSWWKSKFLLHTYFKKLSCSKCFPGIALFSSLKSFEHSFFQILHCFKLIFELSFDVLYFGSHSDSCIHWCNELYSIRYCSFSWQNHYFSFILKIWKENMLTIM